MSDLGTILNPTTVRFEREFPARVDRVWNFLTKPKYLELWLARGTIELSVGGLADLRFDVQEAPERSKAGARIRGIVTCVDPPKRLAYSWVDASTFYLESPVPDSAVTFTLEPKGEASHLALVHRRLPPALLASCAAGWHAHLATLDARIRGSEPEPFLKVMYQQKPNYDRQVAALAASTPAPAAPPAS